MNVRISAGGSVIAEGEDLHCTDAQEMVEAALMLSSNATRGGLRIELSPEPLPPFVPDYGTAATQQPAAATSKQRKKALQ